VTILATASDLAAYLQQDVDTATANLLLAIASAEFETEADTKFSSTSATYTIEGWGQQAIYIPRHPVIAVQSITVDAVAVTDFVRVGSNIYRTVGFGGTSTYPAAVVVTYTYGYTAIPDDVKGAALSIAAQAYASPDGAYREQIDDYGVQRSVNSTGLGMTDYAEKVAGAYRIGAVA
jgi:hypothetical protein